MIPSGKLSEHFSWQEASITSHRDFDNTIPDSLIEVVRNTAKGMEYVREVLTKAPIIVTSWYRSPALNNAIGSNSATSQHPKGEAVDFICPKFGSPLHIVQTLSQSQKTIQFDQLILEHTWVHISFVGIPSTIPRGQVLTLLRNKTYTSGITDLDGNTIS